MHPVNQTTREVQKLKEMNGHTIYTYLQPQFTMRKQSSRSSGGSTDDNIKTLWMIWTWIWLFGKYFWMLLFDQQFILGVGLLFHETGKLMSEQKETTGVGTIGFKDVAWMSTSLLCEKAYQINNAKTYVFSDSVLCVGKMGDEPHCDLEEQNYKWYSENNHFKDMNRNDGMPTEFEWQIFPGITTLGLLEKVQSLMRDLKCEPEHFQRQDRLHVNGQRHCMRRKRKYRNMWIQFTDSCRICSYIPARSFIFLWAWIRKEMVRNLFRQTRRILGPNGRGYDDEFHRFRSSNFSCFQCFLREENYVAKVAERSLFTSTVVMKTWSCFSAWWFLRISSVSTEQ